MCLHLEIIVWVLNNDKHLLLNQSSLSLYSSAHWSRCCGDATFAALAEVPGLWSSAHTRQRHSLGISTERAGKGADWLPATAPLLEGMLRRAEVWQRGSERRRESRRIMEVRFYPITSTTLVKNSLPFVKVFCGIMTKLQKKGFVWKQRGVCLY